MSQLEELATFIGSNGIEIPIYIIRRNLCYHPKYMPTKTYFCSMLSGSFASVAVQCAASNKVMGTDACRHSSGIVIEEIENEYIIKKHINYDMINVKGYMVYVNR